MLVRAVTSTSVVFQDPMGETTSVSLEDFRQMLRMITVPYADFARLSQAGKMDSVAVAKPRVGGGGGLLDYKRDDPVPRDTLAEA